MAFIATYISTVADGSELSSYYEEIVQWTAAADVTAHQLAIKESYDYLNSRLDPYMAVPIQKEATGRYPAIVRDAQASYAVYHCIRRKHGYLSDQAVKAREEFERQLKFIVENVAQFDWAYSPDELGIGMPIPNSSNTSTGTILADRRVDYTGDKEQTYTITITTGGAVETAVYSWADGEGDTTTGITTSYDWHELQNGLSIRFIDSGDTFVLNNTWTIRCVPVNEVATSAAGSIINLEVRI